MWMKKLMKVFSDGSAMWREWRMTGLLKGFDMSGKQGEICILRMYGGGL